MYNFHLFFFTVVFPCFKKYLQLFYYYYFSLLNEYYYFSLASHSCHFPEFLNHFSCFVCISQPSLFVGLSFNPTILGTLCPTLGLFQTSDLGFTSCPLRVGIILKFNFLQTTFQNETRKVSSSRIASLYRLLSWLFNLKSSQLYTWLYTLLS